MTTIQKGKFRAFSSLEKQHLCGECAAFKTPFCHFFGHYGNVMTSKDYACVDFYPSWRREIEAHRKQRREFLRKIENL